MARWEIYPSEEWKATVVIPHGMIDLIIADSEEVPFMSLSIDQSEWPDVSIDVFDAAGSVVIRGILLRPA